MPTEAVTTVVKTKDILFMQIAPTGGTKIQKWCFPDMQLTTRGRGTPTVSLNNSGTRTADFVDVSKTDFSNFEWVSAKNYTSFTKVLGQDCFVFKEKLKVDVEGASVTIPAVACISGDSRLPVVLQYGDEVRTYQFGPPPTEMLVAPPDISKALERWRKSLRQAALPPAKP